MPKTESIKTKCGWCGKEMNCSKSRLAEKQVCIKCFTDKTDEMEKIPVGKLHIDLRLGNFHELAEFIGNSINEMDEPPAAKFYRTKRGKSKESKIMGII